MSKNIPSGVFPTMITPYTDSNKVDYEALEEMIEWYVRNNVQGLFAVCQSSEMFFLSLEERVKIASFVKKKSKGRVSVVASGHISYGMHDQLDEIRRIWETGVDAFVLVSNRMANENESDDVWKANTEKIITELPDVVFGIYECPYPYKRQLSPELLKWCASTGRFVFLKDTCCDIDKIKAKIEAVKGSNLKIFNANSVTLLESLKVGGAGFSGVMGNFHPDLYAWLTQNWNKEPEKAEIVQNFLGPTSEAVGASYPINAKYYMQLEGINIKLNSRVMNAADYTKTNQLGTEQLHELWKSFKEKFMEN